MTAPASIRSGSSPITYDASFCSIDSRTGASATRVPGLSGVGPVLASTVPLPSSRYSSVSGSNRTSARSQAWNAAASFSCMSKMLSYMLTTRDRKPMPRRYAVSFSKRWKA